MSLQGEARKGRVAGLVMLRDMLARQLDECESDRDFAALSRQFTDVLDRIAAVEKPERGGTTVDDLQKRRDARRAGTKGEGSARSGG